MFYTETKSSPHPDNTLTNQPLSQFANICNPIEPSVNRLFGSARSLDSNTMIIPEKAWESRKYGVCLKGTVGESMAVIVDLDGGNEQIVHSGDKVGQAEIKRISRSELVLTGPLGTDILKLAGHSSTSSDKTNKPSQSALKVIQRSDITQLLTNVDKLSQEITLQSVRTASGEPGGFRITALKPGGQMLEMGLMKSDLLTAVNGQKIISVEDVYRVLERAAHKNTLSLKIVRNQTEMELNYVLQ